MPRSTVSLCVSLIACIGGFAVGVTARASGGTVEQVRTPSTMRLLQFNVLDGATDGRSTAVVAVIKASGADVVTLDEVNDPAAFQQIAQATGFHSVYVRANDGFNIGLLSRFPIHACTQFREAPIRHAAYGCRIDISGRSWWIFGTHLYPFDEAVRAQEIQFILKRMNRHLPAPVVLSGDLNTDSPGETYGMGTTVIPLLWRAHYADVFRELHSFQQDPGFTTSTPPYGAEEHRVDYVFRSRLVRSLAARLIDSVDGYQWPSDHKALLVKLAAR